MPEVGAGASVYFYSSLGGLTLFCLGVPSILAPTLPIPPICFYPPSHMISATLSVPSQSEGPCRVASDMKGMFHLETSEKMGRVSRWANCRPGVTRGVDSCWVLTTPPSQRQSMEHGPKQDTGLDLVPLCLVPLWSENIHCMVSAHLNLLRFVLWPSIGSVFVSVPRALEKNVCSAIVGWGTLSMLIRFRWFMVVPFYQFWAGRKFQFYGWRLAEFLPTRSFNYWERRWSLLTNSECTLFLLSIL